MVWDEHDQYVRAKQPTSVAHLWKILQKTGQNYFQCTFGFWWKNAKICGRVKVAEGGHFDKSIAKEIATVLFLVHEE